jgi:hypothetical protein
MTFGASRFRFLLLACASLAAPAAVAAWNFERAEGQALVFKNDKGDQTQSLKTDVPSPAYIAILTDPESSAQYVLYEGKACPSCDVNNTSLYLQRVDGKGKTTSFVPPGKIMDPKKGALVYDGRLFYGHCLPSVKQGVVVHQRESVDRRGIQKSVLIAEPGPQYVYEVLLDRKLPSLNTTLDLVKRKVCTEIVGKTRTVLRKPLNLNPKKGLEDDEEEEDAEVKEKAESKPEDAPKAVGTVPGDS